MAPVRRARRRFGLSCAALALIAGCSSSAKSIPFATPTTQAPSPEQPTGAFRKLAERTNGGLHWKLSQAPGNNGHTCWRLETGPPVVLIQSALECRAPADPNAGTDFNTEFPFETDTTTGYDIVVGFVRRPVKNAQFQYVGGKTADPVFVDKKQGVVV
jgi:hypothetical protein